MEPTLTPIHPEKVAIYIRWSTEDQGEGTTLDVQMEGCRHFVLSQGWCVTEAYIFIDDGYSGATLERPGLHRLRALVRQGAVECVVVYKLDRLSRSVADTARLCMDEWEALCCVKSAREPIDTTSQAGKMFFYTLMNYAEWERTVIRDRTHSGRVRRAQEGRNPGITVPYGYVTDGSTGGFVVVLDEAHLVRRIFDAYQLGAGLLTIANELNAAHITFRGGRPWQVNTIGYMLRNRAYVGDLVWGARMKNPRYQKRAGEKQVLQRSEPLVITAGVFPPLVSMETFSRVATIRAGRPCVQRGGGGRSMASEYLLTGLLRCSGCGRPMVGQHNNPKSSTGYYYCCITRRDQGRSICPATHVPTHLLDSEIEAKLLHLYPSHQAGQQAMHALAGETAARLRAAGADLAGVDRQLSRLAEREQRINRDYVSELLTIEEYRALRNTLQAESDGLRAAQEQLQASLRSLEGATSDQRHLEGQIDQLRLWQDLKVTQRKQLLGQFIQRVSAYKDQQGLRCEITWKVPTP
jgi:site-specific DNA recombinase